MSLTTSSTPLIDLNTLIASLQLPGLPVTDTPEDPKINEVKQKWLARTKELPENKRKLFEAHIQKIAQQASQTLRQMPFCQSIAHSISFNGTMSIEKMNATAQEFFEKCKVHDQNKFGLIQNHNAFQAQIANSHVNFDEVPLPPRQALDPYTMDFSVFPPTSVAHNIATAKVTAKVINIASSTVAVPLKHAASGLHQSYQAVCNLNPTAQSACQLHRKLVTTPVEPIVKIIEEFSRRTGIADITKSISSWNQRANESAARFYAESYGLPLDETRRYVSDCRTVATTLATLAPFGKFKISAPAKIPSKRVTSGIVVARTPQSLLDKEFVPSQTFTKISVFSVSLGPQKTAYATVDFMKQDGYFLNYTLKTISRIKDIALSGSANRLYIDANFANPKLLRVVDKRYKVFSIKKKKDSSHLEEYFDRFEVPLKDHRLGNSKTVPILTESHPVRIVEATSYDFAFDPHISSTAIANVKGISDYANSGSSLKLLGEIREKALAAGAKKLVLNAAGKKDLFGLEFNQYHRYLSILDRRFKCLKHDLLGSQAYEIPLDGSHFVTGLNK